MRRYVNHEKIDLWPIVLTSQRSDAGMTLIVERATGEERTRLNGQTRYQYLIVSLVNS